MKILMLSSTFPYPPSRGGTQIRTFNLLKLLSQKHQITLITQRSPDVSDEEIADLRKMVEQLIVFPRPTTVIGGLADKVQRFGQFWIQGTPPNVLYLYSKEMQQWIDQAIANKQFDVITSEHSINEIYIRPEWKGQLGTVINIHSSLYRTCKNQLETQTSDQPIRDRLYLPLLNRYEQTSMQKFSQIVVTTDQDQQQIQEFAPQTDITVIPNGVDLQTFPYRSHDPGGYNLIFFGGLDYFANIDATCFLAEEIYPKVLAKYPQTTLTLVGSRPSPEVLALGEKPGITVTGRVPSIAQYLHQATVSVISMRTGLGIKNKTLESMAAGTPVVGSDYALEGMTLTNDPLCALRANEADEFVAAISRLFEDSQLRETLSRNGRSLIEKQYTWEAAALSYEEILSLSYQLIQ
jgi:glycosyltransferase involved in cell wall biosynthesis